jgi:hypothetical protein
MQQEGYIYCLTNTCMPGLVKIGMTTEDPEIRAAELGHVTGVPVPFVVAISKRIVNPREKEKAIHELLSQLGFRVNEKREFFTCSLSIIGLLFAVIDGTDTRISDSQAIPVSRRPDRNISVIRLDS